VALVVAATASPTFADEDTSAVEEALRRLRAATGGRAEVSLHHATGVAHLVRLEPGALISTDPTTKSGRTGFFQLYGPAFGVTDPERELDRISSRRNRFGETHEWYRQLYRGIPVFGAEIRVHFDSKGELRTVNGVFVPGIDIDPQPLLSPERARRLAIATVSKQLEIGDSTALAASDAELLVYRSGLLRGESGPDYLVWEVEVKDGAGTREFLYIDAREGTVIEQITGIHTITRVISQGTNANRIWNEGDPLPFSGVGGDADMHINQLIATAEETYRLFENLSGGAYRSWDGADGVMAALYDPEDPPVQCPNAWWDGERTNFCPPLSVVAVSLKKWTHAYTQGTHGLVGSWQVGALNESFSDIFGETVDLLNETGPDPPDARRGPGQCSIHGALLRPDLTIDSPSDVAGVYPAGPAVFNPPGTWSVTAEVELVADGSANPTLGCEPLVDFTPGAIALVDRGECLFVDKVDNAQQAGAAGVIVVNNQGDGLVNMGGEGTFEIPSVFVSQSDGEVLRQNLDRGLRATISQEGGTDDSRRWLVAEDYASGFRDMWNPGCYGDPGRVSDRNYWCDFADSGGIHINAGVPNRAFALAVDGGSDNGYAIHGIGLTKAAHIYWRAMSAFQVPLTDFAMHADLIELSCRDLIGATLTDLVSGAPSPDTIMEQDCIQVARALAAVEARARPSCSLETVLAPDAPLVPGNRTVFLDDFDSDPGDRWLVSNEGIAEEYRPRDWEWTTDLPEGGGGGAFYALNSGRLGTCEPGDDQSGVMFLESPAIDIPMGRFPNLAFDHYVATEARFDGGNVKISVNGGPFRLIEPADFRFNPYGGDLADAAAGRNTNPMAGEAAFSGTDLGIQRGSWGQSQIDLDGLVAPGDTIRLRFDFGVDGCNGVLGWYVDNVLITTTGSGVRASTGRFSR
jgi:Zn-dependent metalloprotease